MAGIYIHIPFCKQACHYCNFHFSTTGKYKGEMVNALCRELELRQTYLDGAQIDSIYLGGGTPSLLSEKELQALFEQIFTLFSVGENPEITLEANPDDLDKSYLKTLANSPVNRLSIGIQSFFDRELTWMNRSHNAEEALSCIHLAHDHSFENITIDLIYGVPDSGMDTWRENLDRFFALNIPHLSAYCLTVEPRTALAHFVKTGQSPPPDDEMATAQFEYLIREMEKRDYLHYEISNFGKKAYLSKHNRSYRQGIPYLGIGPSAHSFDGRSRQWNVANNAKYMKALQAGEIPAEREVLDVRTQYNEYIMTALRTMWGVSSSKLDQFGENYRQYFEKAMAGYLKNGFVEHAGGAFRLTAGGKPFADRIAMEAFATRQPATTRNPR